MKIIPAIDVRNEKCVRLFQGNYNRETVYSADPISVARKWKSQGAQLLHIVDLDGAKSGKSTTAKIVKQIIREIEIPVEVGGGIRTEESIKELFEGGVKRIILGTIVLENIELLKKLIGLYGDKIVVSVDAVNGKLMKKGWLENSDYDLIPTIKLLEKIGVETIIYTDITRDGSLTEPNYESIQLIQRNTKMNLTVAGGISSFDQIKKLKRMNIDGVIIGKALYEGMIDLKEAIEYVS